MENIRHRKHVLLLLLMALLLSGCAAPAATKEALPVTVTPTPEEAAAAEEATVPLPTEYIVLSYPAELEDDVTVHSESIDGGQVVRFTTDFTGEELLLFSFSISSSGDDGYMIGTLTDEQAGELLVCMNVEEYDNGNWKPEDYNKLNAMQERVNDIIIQFHEDPRFEPMK